MIDPGPDPDPGLDPDLARAPYLPCERCGHAAPDVMYDSISDRYLCHACYLAVNFGRDRSHDEQFPAELQ